MNTNNTIYSETADHLRRLLHKWIDEIPLHRIEEAYNFFKVLRNYFCK